jgi:hypothetical protein
MIRNTPSREKAVCIAVLALLLIFSVNAGEEQAGCSYKSKQYTEGYPLTDPNNVVWTCEKGEWVISSGQKVCYSNKVPYGPNRRITIDNIEKVCREGGWISVCPYRDVEYFEPKILTDKNNVKWKCTGDGWTLVPGQELCYYDKTYYKQDQRTTIDGVKKVCKDEKWISVCSYKGVEYFEAKVLTDKNKVVWKCAERGWSLVSGQDLCYYNGNYGPGGTITDKHNVVWRCDNAAWKVGSGQALCINKGVFYGPGQRIKDENNVLKDCSGSRWVTVPGQNLCVYKRTGAEYGNCAYLRDTQQKLWVCFGGQWQDNKLVVTLTKYRLDCYL